MDTRKIDVWESPYDLGKLSMDRQSLCVAKSVTDSMGKVTFNMIWQSTNLSPRMSVSWISQYALNWTLSVPDPGVQVTIGGMWQRCERGQIFDIDMAGVFQPSLNPPKAGFLNIGTSSYPGASGIHIIVGMMNLSGGFDPVCS